MKTLCLIVVLAPFRELGAAQPSQAPWQGTRCLKGTADRLHDADAAQGGSRHDLRHRSGRPGLAASAITLAGTTVE